MPPPPAKSGKLARMSKLLLAHPRRRPPETPPRKNNPRLTGLGKPTRGVTYLRPPLIAETGKPPWMTKKAAPKLELSSSHPYHRRPQTAHRPRLMGSRHTEGMTKPKPRQPKPRKGKVYTPDTDSEDPLVLHRRLGRRRRRGSSGSGAGSTNRLRFASIYCGEGNEGTRSSTQQLQKKKEITAAEVKETAHSALFQIPTGPQSSASAHGPLRPCKTGL